MAAAVAPAPLAAGSAAEQLQPDDLRVRARRRSGSSAPPSDDEATAEPPAPPPPQQQFSQLSQLLRSTAAAEQPAAPAVQLLRCQQAPCQFQTSSAAAMEEHARTHASRRSYECDVCHMRFTNGANLRRHRMRHTGIKPYECRFCSKRFFRRDHLLEHMSTHAKAAGRRLPWQCPVCAKGFQRQIAMRAHYQNEHVRDADWSGTCKLCGFSAPCAQSLQAHLAEQHGLQLGAPAAPAAAAPGTPPLLLPHHFLAPVQLTVDGESPPGSPRPSQQSPNSSQQSPNSSGHVSPTGCRSAPPQLLAAGPTSWPEDGSAAAAAAAAESETPEMNHAPLHVSVKPEPAEEMERTESVQEGLLTAAAPGSGQSPAPGECSAEPRLGGAGGGSSRLRALLQQQQQQRRPASRSAAELAAAAAAPQRRAHLCGLCGILFPDQTLYFLHKGCHTENNPWKCNICSEVCHNVYEFNSHLLSQPHQ